MDEPFSNPCVSPFDTYTILGDGTGYVRYSESFTNSQLNDVSEHIRSETGTSFYGTWMLVAEWNKVALYSEDPVSMIIIITIHCKYINHSFTVYSTYRYTIRDHPKSKEVLSRITSIPEATLCMYNYNYLHRNVVVPRLEVNNLSAVIEK